MKVLQVSDGYPPARGGLERVVQSLATELAARGHTVEVATLSYPGSPALEVACGVTVRRLEGLTRHLQRFSTDPGHHFHPTTVDPQLLRRLQAVVDRLRPEIIHTHGWMSNTALSLRLPTGCALVTTLHDYGLTCAKKTLVHQDQLDQRCPGPAIRRCVPCAAAAYGPLKGAALIGGLLERSRRLDRVHLFLPISTAVSQASLSALPPERVRVIPSFIDDEGPAAADGPPPTFLPDGDFLLFVGALGEHKGLSVLAEAHRRMRHAVPLLLIGAERADTVPPTGSPGRPVVVRTAESHDTIMTAFRAAAVAVVPSRWAEPQGLVALEALRSGTPVVASRIGGLQELVEDGVTGTLVPPGDSRALADAIDAILDHPELRDQWGRSGRVSAARYTAAAVIPAVINAYHDARRIASGS